MPISTEISIFGHANGLPFSKQVRRGMRAPLLDERRLAQRILGAERLGSYCAPPPRAFQSRRRTHSTSYLYVERIFRMHNEKSDHWLCLIILRYVVLQVNVKYLGYSINCFETQYVYGCRYIFSVAKSLAHYQPLTQTHRLHHLGAPGAADLSDLKQPSQDSTAFRLTMDAVPVAF